MIRCSCGARESVSVGFAPGRKVPSESVSRIETSIVWFVGLARTSSLWNESLSTRTGRICVGATGFRTAGTYEPSSVRLSLKTA